jgi:hypothetical protein
MLFQLWLYCIYIIHIHIQGNVANMYAVWIPNSTFMRTHFSTILTNCSLCSWEALGEGKPSWWVAWCSQRERLSQCFLFIASKMSERCSKTDLGDSPPDHKIQSLSIYQCILTATQQKVEFHAQCDQCHKLQKTTCMCSPKQLTAYKQWTSNRWHWEHEVPIPVIHILVQCCYTC